MAEITETVGTEETKTPEEVLKELKKNTVAKEQFDALQARYNKLYSDTANGLFYEEDAEPKGPSEEDQRKAYEEAVLAMKSGKARGSYAQMKNLLIIDDYLTSHGERSAFAPSIGELDAADENMCSAMHDILKYAVDNSGGSNEVASALYSNSIVFGK